MDQLKEKAKPVVKDLLEADSDELYVKLGIYKQAEEANKSAISSFSANIPYNAETMGLMDDVRNFGKHFYQGVSKKCYGLICGDSDENAEEREKVASAFGVGKIEVAAVIAALLVSHFALAPALAAVVAALIIKIVFRPAHDAMCTVWKEKIT